MIEQSEIPMVCNKTGAPYAMLFERTYPGQRLQFIASLPLRPQNSGWFSRSKAVAKPTRPPALLRPINEYDMSGIFCAHCKDRLGFWHCDRCKTLQCKGRYKRQITLGDKAVCSVCSSAGAIGSVMEEVAASNTYSPTTSTALVVPQPLLLTDEQKRHASARHAKGKEPPVSSLIVSIIDQMRPDTLLSILLDHNYFPSIALDWPDAAKEPRRLWPIEKKQRAGVLRELLRLVASGELVEGPEIRGVKTWKLPRPASKTGPVWRDLRPDWQR